MGFSNYYPSSAIARPGVCTSTTRPASPYAGMAIYETDTSRLLIWNGTTWLRAAVSSSDGSVTVPGNIVANTGKFVANRANATSGAFAGGIDFQIDGGTWGQIFLDGPLDMRFTSDRSNFNTIRIANQPSYNGDNTGGGYVSFNGESVKPPNTQINNAAWFNVSTGRFTVSTAGYVLCSFNSLIQRPSNTAHAYVEFQVDGVRRSVRTHTVYDIGGNYQSLNNTAIVYCNANSYVTCNLWTPGAAAYESMYGLGLTFRYLG